MVSGRRRENARKRETIADRRIRKMFPWGFLAIGAVMSRVFGPDALTRKDWPPGLAFEVRLAFAIGLSVLLTGAFYAWRGRRG